MKASWPSLILDSIVTTRPAAGRTAVRSPDRSVSAACAPSPPLTPGYCAELGLHTATAPGSLRREEQHLRQKALKKLMLSFGISGTTYCF
ncbi:hypothetical protein BDA96_01G131000 [Sorghum bicolor]|uniref:Uncharacterized protein n=2 Tax=Sorghum bicolor TaxID=4558 RepID=A0A921RYM0_SORBI|nr:hypothetical protein BDA96_01G131000 [Sorghum bicolor]KXG37782.1 hypothetical protein SORBI_3001G125600 [Sorghum bicolor]